MSRFLQDAMALLETAENQLRSGHTPEDMVILYGENGRLHMVAGSDWTLEALQAEHGATTAFRVTAAKGRVVVEARQNGRTIRLESVGAKNAAHWFPSLRPIRLEPSRPYLIAGPV